jgi:outer membrane protein OmpA-like peptidoglycan-associated protein
MGYDKRSNAKEYKPADGDSLKDIAKRETDAGNPLTWQEIARFNWGTDSLDVVDEFLRDELGCYKRGSDNRFVVSADVDVKTPLLIPKPFDKPGLATTKTHKIKVTKKEKPPKQFEACTRVEGVTFEFDSDKIRESEVADVEKVADEINEHPNAKAMIFGHTDKVGSETYNKDLSERRAKSLFTHLTTKSGIDPSRFMDPKHMGCGEFNPEKDTEAAHEPNRRVTVFLFNPDRLPTLPCAHGNLAPCKKQIKEPLPRNKDSFHCSFYDSIAKNCPAEGGGPVPPTKGWPINIKGKLFWNRTWDYNDEVTPIGPIKEYLPAARVELRIQTKGGSSLTVHKSINLTDDGEFLYENVPEIEKAELRIFLEHRDGKIVNVKGKTFKGSTKPFDEPDFKVHTGKIVWHQLPLDISGIDGTVAEVDLGDVEITKGHFVEICDAYKTVWFGHKRLIELGGDDLPLCQINYPEDPDITVSNASDTMQLCRDDLRDRDVILHEYGHFIGTKILGGLTFDGYDYNDEPGHNFDTKEHYTSAWNEGHATFLSCALTDDPHYHDGYDTNPSKTPGGGLNFHLDTDDTKIGPHCEGSIQECLWRILKVHGIAFKDGFWKAFKGTTNGKVDTIFKFFDSWKALGCPSIDKVVESYKHFNMEYGYNYRDGAGRFTRVAPPATIDVAAKKFQTVAELHNEFGSLDGGTLTDYNEEFYNRNNHFNSGSLGAGSSQTDPKVVTGKKYIVPERFKIQP